MNDFIHRKALKSPYPGSNQERFPVPLWSIKWRNPFIGEDEEPTDYLPVSYTAPCVLAGPCWADQQNPEEHMVPRNPVGRTGIVGRGLLGKWGANYAADPIVSRWKKNSDGTNVLGHDNKPVLEVVLIVRQDNGEWAIPGGMVDKDEQVSVTLRREFGEEALNTLELPEGEKRQVSQGLNNLFRDGVEIYKGYVDDPRNTDNAWMETTAVNFHDDTGITQKLKLEAGDDAKGVKWVSVSKDMNLYASHCDFIGKVIDRLNASHY